jgi:malate dehydrogenase (oxaloacetate-decarboxylating)
MSALKLRGTPLSEIMVVLNGAGSAGIAVARLLISVGVGDIIMCDTRGAIYRGRKDGYHRVKEEIARLTNKDQIKGSLSDALVGADVFVGVSAPNVLTAADVETMADGAIVFALANPEPEIQPQEAARHAAVVATGRSDYPNQINNVLAFPGVFRGLLDAHSKSVSTEMLIAAARALAETVSEKELNPAYIVPSVFHPGVAETVAGAVRESVEAIRKVAEETGEFPAIPV